MKNNSNAPGIANSLIWSCFTSQVYQRLYMHTFENQKYSQNYIFKHKDLVK